jgi:hypothetical protein
MLGMANCFTTVYVKILNFISEIDDTFNSHKYNDIIDFPKNTDSEIIVESKKQINYNEHRVEPKKQINYDDYCII